MVSLLRRFGQFQTQDTLEIYSHMTGSPAYTDTGRTDKKGLNKMCDVPVEPPAGYLAGSNIFTCAHWDEKHSSAWARFGMFDRFFGSQA